MFNPEWVENDEEWAIQEFVYAIHKKEFVKSQPANKTLNHNGNTINVTETFYEASFSDKTKFSFLHKDFELYDGKLVEDFYSFNGFIK